MKVNMLCIAKNEDRYIDEWVQYHKKLGIDEFYIYENNWRCNLNYEYINKIPFDGNAKQIPAYNHYFENYSDKADWVVVIDIDEFIVLKKHNNIKELITDYDNGQVDGIGINWVLFGDNGLDKVYDDNYSVIDRFTRSGASPNRHVKVIVKSIKDLKYKNPHTPEHGLKIIDTSHNRIIGPFNCTGITEVAQINHYHTKTKEEYLAKINRGRATTTKFKNVSNFNPHNQNEVEDLQAFNFYHDIS